MAKVKYTYKIAFRYREVNRNNSISHSTKEFRVYFEIESEN